MTRLLFFIISLLIIQSVTAMQTYNQEIIQPVTSIQTWDPEKRQQFLSALVRDYPNIFNYLRRSEAKFDLHKFLDAKKDEHNHAREIVIPIWHNNNDDDKNK